MIHFKILLLYQSYTAQYNSLHRFNMFVYTIIIQTSSWYKYRINYDDSLTKLNTSD